MLSGLSRCAGLVVAPKTERPLKHIEFVHLGPGRALVVLVTEDGMVENRVIEVPLGLPPSTLVEADQLPERAAGRPHDRRGARRASCSEIEQPPRRARRADRAGWSRPGSPPGPAASRGRRADRARPGASARRRARRSPISSACARCSRRWRPRRPLLRLLDAADQAEGVQIFIGAESELFGLAGCSMVIAPYRNSREQIVGAIGVIGPTPHQLCPHHPDGRLHRQGDRPRSAPALSVAPIGDEDKTTMAKTGPQRRRQTRAPRRSRQRHGRPTHGATPARRRAVGRGRRWPQPRPRSPSSRTRLLRALAETENVRRRAQREREDAAKYAIASFAQRPAAGGRQSAPRARRHPRRLRSTSDEALRRACATASS